MAILIKGISLKRVGNHAVVYAEDVFGNEIEVIRELYDGCFCHHVSEGGIRDCFDKSYKKDRS